MCTPATGVVCCSPLAAGALLALNAYTDWLYAILWCLLTGVSGLEVARAVRAAGCRGGGRRLG